MWGGEKKTKFCEISQNSLCSSGLHGQNGNTTDTTIEWEKFIEFYFDLGLKYKDIKTVLGSRHGFDISERRRSRIEAGKTLKTTKVLLQRAELHLEKDSLAQHVHHEQ